MAPPPARNGASYFIFEASTVEYTVESCRVYQSYHGHGAFA